MSATNLLDVCKRQWNLARRRGTVRDMPYEAWLLAPTGAQIRLWPGGMIFKVQITQPGHTTADRTWMVDSDETRQEPENQGRRHSWRKRPMSQRDIDALMNALPLPRINSVYGYRPQRREQVTHLLSPWLGGRQFGHDLVYMGEYALPGQPRSPLFRSQGKTGDVSERLDIAMWWREMDAGGLILLDQHIANSRLPVYWDTGLRPARYILVPGKAPWTGVDGPALYLGTVQGRPLQAVTLTEANRWRGRDLRPDFKK